MDEAWEKAVEAALEGEEDAASARSLTLDGAVKCVQGRLPHPSFFQKFEHLKQLSIANIGVSSLADFPRLKHLEKLILSDNRIAGGLEHLVKAGLDSLRDLDLSNNKIQSLHDLEPLAQLKIVSLDLYECPVTRVEDYRARVFEMIKSLKYLDKVDAFNRPESDDEDDDEDEEEDKEVVEIDDDEEDDDNSSSEGDEETESVKVNGDLKENGNVSKSVDEEDDDEDDDFDDSSDSEDDLQEIDGVSVANGHANGQTPGEAFEILDEDDEDDEDDVSWGSSSSAEDVQNGAETLPKSYDDHVFVEGDDDEDDDDDEEDASDAFQVRQSAPVGSSSEFIRSSQDDVVFVDSDDSSGEDDVDDDEDENVAGDEDDCCDIDEIEDEDDVSGEEDDVVLPQQVQSRPPQLQPRGVVADGNGNLELEEDDDEENYSDEDEDLGDEEDEDNSVSAYHVQHAAAPQQGEPAEALEHTEDDEDSSDLGSGLDDDSESDGGLSEDDDRENERRIDSPSRKRKMQSEDDGHENERRIDSPSHRKRKLQSDQDNSSSSSSDEERPKK